MKNIVGILLLLTVSLNVHASLNVSDRTVQVDSLLKQAIELSERKEYVHAFQMLEELKELAEQKDDAELLFWCYTNWGINQSETMNYDDALDAFFKAYELATTKLDKRKEMSITNNIAGLYFRMGKLQEAEEFYMRNYKHAQELGDTVLIGGSALNIALTSLQMFRLEDCDRYLDIARKYIKDNTPEAYRLELLRMGYFLETRAYESVIYGGLSLLAAPEVKKNKNILIEVRSKMAKAYLEMGNYEKAIEAAKQGLADDDEISCRVMFYAILSRIYEKMGDYRQVVNYKDSLIAANDSLFRRVEHNLYVNSDIQLELLQNEKKAGEYKARSLRNLILFSSSLVVCILLVWALIATRARLRQKQHIAALQIDQQKKSLEILQNKQREQDAEALLRKREYQLELEKKNRELMSKAMFVAHRNESIQNIIEQLSKDVKIDRNSQLDRNIRQLKLQMAENKEWENFTVYFEQINQEFIWKLREKHPDLTANEIRFLSLVYIGLNNKEISAMLNITTEYCKKKKQAISHKLGLESTQNLYAYLINF